MNNKAQERILHWLPVVVWYGVIFILSSIPGKTLESIVPETFQFWCHRAAHVIEYGILGILVMRPLRK